MNVYTTAAIVGLSALLANAVHTNQKNIETIKTLNKKNRTLVSLTNLYANTINKAEIPIEGYARIRMNHLIKKI